MAAGCFLPPCILPLLIFTFRLSAFVLSLDGCRSTVCRSLLSSLILHCLPSFTPSLSFCRVLFLFRRTLCNRPPFPPVFRFRLRGLSSAESIPPPSDRSFLASHAFSLSLWLLAFYGCSITARKSPSPGEERRAVMGGVEGLLRGEAEREAEFPRPCKPYTSDFTGGCVGEMGGDTANDTRGMSPSESRAP